MSLVIAPHAAVCINISTSVHAMLLLRAVSVGHLAVLGLNVLPVSSPNCYNTIGKVISLYVGSRFHIRKHKDVRV